MRSLLPQTALVALTALAHGGLIGTAMAVHLAQHEHDELGHDRSAAIAYIVHGHDHGPGTPDHEHSIVYAKPAPQHLKRFDLPDPPSSASLALLMPEPRFSLSLRRAPELCGPSPPLLHRSLIALRI